MRKNNIDWINGVITLSPGSLQSPQDEWSCIVCGDWAPLDKQQIAIEKNPESFYGDLLPILRSSNLSIVNLEGVIANTPAKPIIKDGMGLCFPTNIITGLSSVPFRLACLANNHIFDYGVDGLDSTLSLLSEKGIQTVGAGLDEITATTPWVDKVGNTRIGVLNIAEGEEARSKNGGPGAASVDKIASIKQLQRLKEEADIRIVIVHAGREHLPFPAPYIREMYRSFVENGASIVIGHHPHVPQGIEIYKGTPIAYSLGNFGLYVKTPLKYHTLGYLLEICGQGETINQIKIWPYKILAENIELLNNEAKIQFLTELEAFSELITSPGKLEEIWGAYSDRWWQSVGASELSSCLADLGETKDLLRASLNAQLQKYDGAQFHKKIGRALLSRVSKFLVKSKQTGTSYTDIQKHGAAVLRNRFETPAHRELYLTALGRIITGKSGTAAAWAYEYLDHWFKI